MAEISIWTPEDDTLVRRALSSLSEDVAARPLPQAHVVRAQARARRMRRYAAPWLAVAVAAAAVLVVVFTQTTVLPAPPPGPATTGGGTSAQSPSGPSPSAAFGFLDQPHPLPLALEWSAAAAVSGGMQTYLEAAYTGLPCPTAFPGVLARAERVQSDYSPMLGSQFVWSAASEALARTGAEALASSLTGCPAAVATPVRAGSWPRTWTTVEPSGRVGAVVIAQAGRDVTWLQIGRSAGPQTAVPADTLATLAELAQQRLVRYGPSLAAPSATQAPSFTSVVAIDEAMPVDGPTPLLSSTLFVAASQWASPAVANGHRTTSAAGEWEGMSTVAPGCDPDTTPTGRFGLVGIVDVVTGTAVGAQRVRVFDSPAAADAGLAQLIAAYDTCPTTTGDTVVTSVTRGPAPGTWRVTETVSDTPNDVVTFVGVTRLRSQNAVATIVLTAVDGPSGFGELERLVGLAAQK